MKAMTLKKPHPIEDEPLVMVEIADPIPRPEKVRIQTLTCGVCHTDLHVVEGELPSKKLPVIPSLAAEVPIRMEVQAFALEEANRSQLLLKQGSIQGVGVLRVSG